MLTKYQFDKLDLNIIKALQNNSRKPFLEIARELNISGGTVHARLSKLEKVGVIKGYSLILDEKKVGLGICCLVGITLKSTYEYKKVLEQLKAHREIVDAWYTTGTFSLILKVLSEDMDSFHHFLLEKLQKIKAIQSTETFMILDNPIKREVLVTIL